MLRNHGIVLATLCGLTVAGAALAQGTGPNGGLIGGTGAHQTELVVSPTELVVYLLEGGKVHDAKGSKLRAVIQQDGKTSTVNLVSSDGNRLVGKLRSPLAKGAIVVLTGKDGHGDAVSSRYVIK